MARPRSLLSVVETAAQGKHGMTSTISDVRRETADAPDGARYTRTAQALHWLTLIAIAAILPIAWVMTNLPAHDPRGGLLFSLHKSLGLTIWLLIAARLAWRFRHPAPALAPGTPSWMDWAGKANHWLMYLVFFAMPISGYVMAAMGKHGVQFWGVPLPSLPRVEWIDHLADTGHSLGQWAVYALVLLHIAATAWHVGWRRDGLLQRMLPPQTNAGA